MKISSTTHILLFLLCIAFLLHSDAVTAQESDFQTWSSAGIKKELSKNTDFLLSQELRLKDNSTRLNSTFTDVGFKYRLFKNLDGGLYYRLIIFPDAVAHRPYAEMSYEIDIQKWSVEPRLRFQHQEERNEVAKNYFRPKATLSYKINKQWKPFVAGELFYHAFYYQGSQFDEYRLSAGVEYDWKKHHALKLFYLFDKEFNVNDPLQRHVTGLAYEYDF
ncbi:MAG: DUF2490 domain-containing protein [Chitinophagales bacterium]